MEGISTNLSNIVVDPNEAVTPKYRKFVEPQSFTFIRNEEQEEQTKKENELMFDIWFRAYWAEEGLPGVPNITDQVRTRYSDLFLITGQFAAAWYGAEDDQGDIIIDPNSRQVQITDSGESSEEEKS